LVGMEFAENGDLTVDPLLPGEAWDWFALDGVRHGNRTITVLWDRTGEKYRRGAGMTVMIDGRTVAAATDLTRLSIKHDQGRSVEETP